MATATRIGVSGAAAADGIDKDDEPISLAPPSTGISPRDLANPITQTLSAADFVPRSNSGLTWAFAGGGGVLLTAGAAYFDGGLRVPAGAGLTGAQMLIHPNGSAQSVGIRRYRVIPPAPGGGELVASAASTAGTAPEAVPLAVTHTIEAGWAYRFEIFLSAFGPVLYGASVTYTIPPDPPFPAPPTGLFVPFAGSNPRVYDTRAGLTKLAANQERVIPLGVPGTAQAAVFNLTATETESAGFVACFRADISWPGNSSINWYESGANVANLVICAVDATGSIKIRGGNDSTHVVIDLVGTYA